MTNAIYLFSGTNDTSVLSDNNKEGSKSDYERVPATNVNGSKFMELAATPTHPDWEKLVERNSELYKRDDDVRSPFARDYTRILHSYAYRRLKHKTQVFFNIENDHICTRMEHVAHVESVSNTIASHLGLNTELTKAIAMGHDLGHAPFGHTGEKVIKKLSEKYLDENFWHERNGVYFVDNIELLADTYNCLRNLDLTYAVRDGIISHCGELDENGIHPREEYIDLNNFKEPGQYQPATWEGCVVKIADKIAYLGRDIEDALSLGFLDEKARDELLKMASRDDVRVLNTTVIMHNMIIDICNHSTPEKGICLSEHSMEQMNQIKNYNYEHIYQNERLQPFIKYSELVINELFETLYASYGSSGTDTWGRLHEKKRFYPTLVGSFEEWLAKYCDEAIVPDEFKSIYEQCGNKKIYASLENKQLYARAVIDFISGMTDRFAVKAFQDLLEF